MEILFYRYGYMLEDSCKNAFISMGIQVNEEWGTFEDKGTTSGKTIQKVYDNIIKEREKGKNYLFVFSINFFPAISEICEKMNMLYLSWSADNPVMEMFTNSIKNKCNRIFLFDRAQYDRFHKYNPEGIFHLPLAADVDMIQEAVKSHMDQTSEYDISMIGSLYVDRSPIKKMEHISDYTKGFLDSLINAQSRIYGCNFLEKSLNDQVIADVKDVSIDQIDTYAKSDDVVEPLDAYVVSQLYLAKDVTAIERCNALKNLSQIVDTHLFTSADDEKRLQRYDKKDLIGNTIIHGPVNPYEEAPAIFHKSKINLNATLISIETGIPLRIFEILAAGGFCITNYQEELQDYFEIGKDLEVYSSDAELVALCDYYLSHDEERQEIARNGFEKVKNYHQIHMRIMEMIRLIMKNNG